MVGINIRHKFRTIIVRWLSDEGLTKKAYLNALVAMIDYGARLLVGFIVNPILLAGLGDYLFGVWQILVRAIGFISAASGRPTQALKWTLAAEQDSFDYDNKRRHVGSAVVIWLLFLPILLVMGSVLSWYVPDLLDVPREYTWTVRLAAGLLVLNLILISFTEVPRSILIGQNLGYKRMGLSALLIFAGAGITILALYLNFGLIGVATANLITTFLTGLLFLLIVRRVVTWFGIARPTSTAVRKFFGLSGWFLVWSIVIKLMMASDVIILGIFDSVTTVTTYSLTKYVPETIITLVTIIVFGITPGLGGIIGRGELAKATSIRGEIMALTWLITTTVGTTTLLLNQTFVRLWVGAEYYAGSLAVLLIVLMVTQFVLIRNDANIIDLTLDLRHKVILGGISATLSIVVTTVLIGEFGMGIPGLCLGFIVGRLLLSVGYPWLVGQFLGQSLFSQLKGVVRPAIATALFLGLGLNLSRYLNINSWIGLILAIGATLVMVSPLVFYIGLSHNQRKKIWRRVDMMTGPLKSK